MNARTLVVVAAVALVTPVVATGRTVPPKPYANALAEHHLVTTGAPARKHVVVKVAKKVAPKPPRILCICVVNPGPPSGVPPMTQDEFERLVDEDMVAHGLEPIYGTTTSAQTAAG